MLHKIRGIFKISVKHMHTTFFQFQGPALLAYNDAEFTNADWKGIVSLGISVKEKDPLKVGRFGLGFKSVFHLTGSLLVFFVVLEILRKK